MRIGSYRGCGLHFMRGMLILFLFFMTPVHGEQQTTFTTPGKTDKERSGLIGTVKSVKIEEAEMKLQDDGYVESGRRLVEVHNYDKDGRLIGTKFRIFGYGSFEPPSGVEPVYDKQGRVIELLWAKQTIATFTYDKRGNVTSSTEHRRDILVTSNLRYDPQGNVSTVEQTFHRKGILELRTVIEFDRKVDFTISTEKDYRENGSLESTTVAKFDRLGNELEFKVTWPNSDFVNHQLYVYEFDSIGNWVKQTRMSIDKKKVYGIVYRTITYYEQ